MAVLFLLADDRFLRKQLNVFTLWVCFCNNKYSHQLPVFSSARCISTPPETTPGRSVVAEVRWKLTMTCGRANRFTDCYNWATTVFSRGTSYRWHMAFTWISSAVENRDTAEKRGKKSQSIAEVRVPFAFHGQMKAWRKKVALAMIYCTVGIGINER